jgi:hypothetical protein
MSAKTKRKPVKRDEPTDTGLALILRKRRPKGGFVVLAKYSRLKNVA